MSEAIDQEAGGASVQTQTQHDQHGRWPRAESVEDFRRNRPRSTSASPTRPAAPGARRTACACCR